MTARSDDTWAIAVESFDLAPAPIVRPGVWRWLRYAYWGGLPERHAVWVLYDNTCRTWVLRHVARVIVAVAPPVALLALFIPAAGGVRALTACVTGACAVLFTTMYVNESTGHRLYQAGYPWRVGSAVRAKRDEVAQYRRNW